MAVLVGGWWERKGRDCGVRVSDLSAPQAFCSSACTFQSFSEGRNSKYRNKALCSKMFTGRIYHRGPGRGVPGHEGRPPDIAQGLQTRGQHCQGQGKARL